MNPARQILFRDVCIFDGRHNGLSESSNVLVRDELIEKISPEAIIAEGATIVEAGDRTLMPGLIDAHVHLDINRDIQDIVLHADRSDLAIRSTVVARDMLMDGWTSVRDRKSVV